MIRYKYNALWRVLASLLLTGSFVAIMAAGCSNEDSGTATQEQDSGTATQENEQATSETKTYDRGDVMKNEYSSPPEMTVSKDKEYFAKISTTEGDITVQLFVDEVPVTVNNFVFLAREGFYTDVKFHRVVKDFMIQGGDPTGTGAGGPGYSFADEPVTRDYVAGTLAMANSGPNTNGSQFFIMHGNVSLPKNYTIFGLVTEGIEVVDKIANIPVTLSKQGERSVPEKEILIKSVVIEEN